MRSEPDRYDPNRTDVIRTVMKEFESIKNFYRPVQPTIPSENNDVLYKEIPPSREIENFVNCFWQLKTRQVLASPFVYRVVSDGCIDIFFEHDRPSENFVMGFCRKYTEFSLGKEFHYVGIRFLPSAFPLLFGINAKVLSNTSQRLQNVLPAFSNWIATQINPSNSFAKIAKLLSTKLEILKNKKEYNYDLRFFRSLILILKNKGYVDTGKDLDTGLSPRQLRRIFNFYIGTTAKAFSNVVRFQYILNAIPSDKSPKRDKIYFDVGFFDQAHFIKNFKTFYGVTPAKAFR